jgi:predicted DNA-binding transcriptional regulator YafY
VRLSYTSVESGKTEREIVPFALVDIGTRWQVRAFCRRRRMFLDFALTRMEHPMLLEDSPIGDGEKADRDFSWARMLELELVPHPNHERTEVVCMDYDLKDGKLRVNVRAAHVGYMLHRLGVDCSPDHRLSWREYDLWLPDALALYGANAYLAPGYKHPGGEK